MRQVSYENNQLMRNTTMSTSDSSSKYQRRQRLFVAAALAVFGLGAAAYGIRSRLALAEPISASPPQATTPMTPQSVPPRAANGELDFGPGDCEPCLVASP